MGFWDSGSDKKVKDASGMYSSEPGAIPVATPVPEIRAQQQQYQQYQQVPTKGVSAPPTTVMNPTAAFESSDPTLARVPMFITKCPNCHQESRTRISTYPTWQTWTATGVMLFVFWPICWVPLVMDNCKQTDHFCVLCQTKVGKVDAFQDCCVTERS